jgi:5-methylcytosine-specific restriction protein A
VKRVRLSTRQRVECFEASGGVCHLCGGKIIVGEKWEVSHDTPLELGGEDTPENRKPAHYRCHRAHTAAVDLPNIAKAKRREARHIGARAPSSRPIPGSRASGIKKRMDGTVERRST